MRRRLWGRDPGTRAGEGEGERNLQQPVQRLGQWALGCASFESERRGTARCTGSRRCAEDERAAASYWGRGVLVWGEDNTAVEEYRHERSGRTGADSREVHAFREPQGSRAQRSPALLLSTGSSKRIGGRQLQRAVSGPQTGAMVAEGAYHDRAGRRGTGGRSGT